MKGQPSYAASLIYHHWKIDTLASHAVGKTILVPDPGIGDVNPAATPFYRTITTSVGWGDPIGSKKLFKAHPLTAP